MHKTNPSPYFKGLEQKMAREVEGKLQGVQAKIRELEMRLEAADGKTQAQNHEWLEELTRGKEEGTPSTPKPSMPSPLITPK